MFGFVLWKNSILNPETRQNKMSIASYNPYVVIDKLDCLETRPSRTMWTNKERQQQQQQQDEE